MVVVLRLLSLDSTDASSRCIVLEVRLVAEPALTVASAGSIQPFLGRSVVSSALVAGRAANLFGGGRLHEHQPRGFGLWRARSLEPWVAGLGGARES